MKLSSILSLLFLAGFLSATTTTTTTTTLPTFDYETLSSSSSSLLTSLLNNGGLVIENIPGFEQARKEMLHSPLSFDPTYVGSSQETDEVTGLNRLTVSSMVINGQRDNNHNHNNKNMASISDLRDIVDDVVEEFLFSLSSVAPSKMLGVVYPNGAVAPITEVSRKGEGIEHYHYYTKPSSSGPFHPVKPTVMELHRDAGCFIAMTVGGDSSGEGEDPFVLSVVTPKGEIVPASASPNSLIILLGDGMSQYLSTSLPFPSLPHSLTIRDMESFSDRGWYGRMYFPPGNSVQEDGNLFSTTFKSLSEDETRPSNGILGATNGCGEGEIFCWKQCMDATQLACEPESALCLDTGSNTVILFPDSRDDMCPSGMANCELVCPESLNGYDNTTHPTDHNETGFCTGTGTSMFMDGFQFVLSGGSPCLNWFFIPATMDSWWKFIFGMAGQFLLAFGVEALSLLRRRIFKKFEVIPQEQRNFYKFIMFSLHILQALVGYLIMLGAMTYSVEVLVSVVLGLGVGYLVFNSEFPVTAKAEPCCMENYNSVN